MLRWAGLLAIVTSVLLVALLLSRTTRNKVSGVVTFQNRSSTPAKLRITLPIRSEFPPNDWPPLERRSELATAGLSGQWIGVGEDEKTTICTWSWEAEVPEEITEAAGIGDEAILASIKLTLPGLDHDLRFVRYEFRNGARTQLIGGPSNGKFFLAYGLAGVGPLLLWAIACGIVLLCNLGRRKAQGG